MTKFTRDNLNKISKSLMFEPVDQKTCDAVKELVMPLLDDGMTVKTYIEDGEIKVELNFADPQDATVFILRF